MHLDLWTSPFPLSIFKEGSQEVFYPTLAVLQLIPFKL